MRREVGREGKGKEGKEREEGSCVPNDFSFRCAAPARRFSWENGPSKSKIRSRSPIIIRPLAALVMFNTEGDCSKAT
jgi:hypothetical protein